MPEGGILAVGTDLVKTDSRTRVIRLTIEDTESGMDPTAQEHAFESFYTTKEGGTGLGLPFVRRVAEVHGGRVVLESQEGEGTSISFEIAA